MSVCKICGFIRKATQGYIHPCKILTFYDYKRSRSITSNSNFSFVRSSLNLRMDEALVQKFDREIESAIEANQSLESQRTQFIVYSRIKNLFNPKFPKRRNKLLRYDDQTIKTIFTNEEIIHLASGVKQKEVNGLARKYLSGVKLDLGEWFFLHNVIMNGVNEHGLNFVQELLKLEKMPFRVDHTIRVFKILDKIRNKGLNPILRLKVGSVIFSCEYVPEKSSKPAREFLIYKTSPNHGKKLAMTIDREGICRYGNYDLIPIFQIVESISHNLKESVCGYGLAEGKCSICNKPLTDPDSIRRGIGPVCDQLF